MSRKVCNNKVEFSACGKSIIFRLSDNELRNLRISSIWKKGDDITNATYGYMYNFSAYAFFDYDVKGSKAGRFHFNFPYHDFDRIMWNLIK